MADHKGRKDEISGKETTGHEWDGIEELNNPAPRWWLLVWLICIIFAVGYWYFYPAWPVPGGNTKGELGWTAHKELAQQQALIDAQQKPFVEKFHNASLDDIIKDPELYKFARAGGAAAFKNNCAVCHGSDAAGGKGFPNLNDDDWLWGGKLEDIYHTIKVGIRSGHPDARVSQMPAFGKDGILTPAQIDDVAGYVQKLHLGDKADKDDAYKRGADIFAQNCAACHGPKGDGNQAVGAPRLNDDIWLYGGDKATIINTITYAPAGVMPTWEKRLSEDTIKELAVYVHSLGGGQ